MRKVILAYGASALTILSLVVLDRVVGLFVRPFLFPPHVEIHHVTSEYAYVVRTNLMGFRDRELAPWKSGGKRIAIVGDSMTYGWGLNHEETWPKLLEDELRRDGLDVEVANLGRPDSDTRDYAAVVADATALLHPDLIVIAVTQGDDLASLENPPAERHDERSLHLKLPVLAQMTELLFGNLRFASSAVKWHVHPASEITDEWKAQVQGVLAQLSALGRERLSRVSPKHLAMFVRGDLNPGLLNAVLHRPRQLKDSLDPDSPSVKELISRMANDFRRARASAAEGKAETVVIAVPVGIYVSRGQYDDKSKMGLELSPRMLSTDLADRGIELAARQAGLQCGTFTEAFRRNDGVDGLFFEADGHFNRLGARFFARSIAPFVKERVRQTRTGTP